MTLKNKKIRIIAMIPSRMGSKRVKKKNIRLIDGKPLIQYIIDKVSKSNKFDEIYINSEDKIFNKIAKKNNIFFFQRNKRLSSDKCQNDEFAFDFIKKIKGDILIQILPTSPLISTKEINSFVDEMINKKYETLISIEEKRIATVYENKPINFNKFKRVPPSQKVKPVKTYATVLMGWTYESFKNNMLKYNAAYHGGNGKIGYFAINTLSAIDIDNEEDFQLAEKIIISEKIKINKRKIYYK